MKLNKSAYLFAAALVAGTMGMTSCSSEDVIDATEQGVENKVTLALSVADKFGTRSTADEVNLGSKLQEIKNVVVVPMIGDACLNPIVMGDLNPESATSTITKTASLNSNINRFKVYGNVDAANFNADKVFTGFTLTATSAGQKGSVNVYKPHGLYYYGYAGTETNKIWAGSDESNGTDLTAGTNIGTNKYIKLSNVNYAVGVLGAAVLNGDNTTPAYTLSDGTYSESGKAYENITVSGIIINNQKLKLDQDFAPVSGENSVGAIYETADPQKTAFVSEGNKLSGDNTDDGNLYVVVTETEANENVSANIEFTLAANKYIKIGDNKYIGGTTETKFYLPVSLKPVTGTGAKAVFMKDYSTFLNATVKNWGLASETPVEVTDATIAVTVDLTWQTGIVYDQDI